jgi:Mn-dependent DtxR family transcriptional regulator
MSKGPTAQRLRDLKRAHQQAQDEEGPSPRVEDYIEVIYELILQKGYARIADISQHLAVSSPTVSKTVQRLDDEELVEYERYRGVKLTSEGETLAEDLRRRHSLVKDFLELIGVEEEAAHRVTEGIEHHVDAATLERIADFVDFAEERPAWIEEFQESRRD